ncbi:MAG TPA: hypothetical protein VNF73_01920 [Candidatus Saccharimonadales bacterium]|nr:hypothetical protein [Candidatus Saccharimonadales bacterium]
MTQPDAGAGADATKPVRANERANASASEPDGTRDPAGARRVSQNRLTRHVDAGLLLETFLVSGVVAVLVVRAFLEATGFPKVGGGGLHIAHLLWGGLLMVAALMLLFLYLDRRIQHLAAVVAGVGFGLFIDEIGKFITSDSNYFFQPAVSIIYVVFIAMFLVVRAVLSGPALTARESLANALFMLVDGIDGSTDEQTRSRIVQLLDRSQPDHPLVGPLQRYTASLERRGWLFGLADRVRTWIDERYDRAIGHPWFERVLVAVVTFYSLAALVSVGYLVVTQARFGGARIDEIGQTLSTVAGAAIVLRGVPELRRARVDAYHWFLRGVLVWILVTQIFVFYNSQLAGLIGLAADLAAYGGLRYMVRNETAHESRKLTMSVAAAASNPGS